MTLQVIKIGGAALANATWLESFACAAAMASPETVRVIVHGGGPEITELSTRLGISTEWHNGRRVTSEAALDAATMVLNGLINKRIVRALRAQGVDAFGFSAQDGAVVLGKVVEDGALGRVGEVVAVRSELLRKLLALGLVPVISPVSLGDDGGALNINADEVAMAIAQQLEATELLFLTDVPGVRTADQECAPALSTHEALQAIEQNVATGGMALKLSTAVQALNTGVSRVRVGDLSMLHDNASGTALYAEALACR